MPQFAIEFKPSADKALQRLPAEVQRRVVAATERLAVNPRPVGAVKLEGEGRRTACESAITKSFTTSTMTS